MDWYQKYYIDNTGYVHLTRSVIRNNKDHTGLTVFVSKIKCINAYYLYIPKSLIPEVI